MRMAEMLATLEGSASWPESRLITQQPDEGQESHPEGISDADRGDGFLFRGNAYGLSHELGNDRSGGQPRVEEEMIPISRWESSKNGKWQTIYKRGILECWSTGILEEELE